MAEEFEKPSRSWYDKFRDAFAGMAFGVRNQSSFVVHFICAALVIALGIAVGLTCVEWSLLVICIFGVMCAEMFNSALETLAKAIDTRYNPHLENGLNIASGAVLLCSMGAVVVGILIFFGHLIQPS